MAAGSYINYHVVARALLLFARHLRRTPVQVSNPRLDQEIAHRTATNAVRRKCRTEEHRPRNDEFQ